MVIYIEHKIKWVRVYPFRMQFLLRCLQDLLQYRQVPEGGSIGESRKIDAHCFDHHLRIDSDWHCFDGLDAGESE